MHLTFSIQNRSTAFLIVYLCDDSTCWSTHVLYFSAYITNTRYCIQSPAVHIVTVIILSPLNSFLLFRNIVDVPVKKTRTALTLETKFDIIQRLESGETASSLGRLYNVNESSIRTIRKNAEKIRSYIAQSCSVTTNKMVKMRTWLFKEFALWLKNRTKGRGLSFHKIGTCITCRTMSRCILCRVTRTGWISFKFLLFTVFVHRHLWGTSWCIASGGEYWIEMLVNISFRLQNVA